MFNRIGRCKLCNFDIAGYKSVSLPCWHLFHYACLKELMNVENYSCPTCLEPFTEELKKIRLSKIPQRKEFVPTLNPIIEETSSSMDPVSTLEGELLYQTSYQYPPQMISKLSSNMLISEARIAAKSALQLSTKKPIKSFQEAILAQWMLKHVKDYTICDSRMAEHFEETEADVSWLISRQKDILKFFVQ